MDPLLSDPVSLTLATGGCYLCLCTQKQAYFLENEIDNENSSALLVCTNSTTLALETFGSTN